MDKNSMKAQQKMMDQEMDSKKSKKVKEPKEPKSKRVIAPADVDVKPNGKDKKDKKDVEKDPKKNEKKMDTSVNMKSLKSKLTQIEKSQKANEKSLDRVSKILQKMK